jgi:DNA primase
MLAHRFGIPVPELAPDGSERSDAAEREALLKVHEAAAAWFVAQLARPAGARARQQLTARGLVSSTVERLGLGFAPASRDGLKAHLLGQGFSLPLIVRGGLVVERERGETVDRFRGRLMIPICRDAGSVVAFGGRVMDPDQQPKYLNSPETPIYTKSRTLYGLHLTKAAIRAANYAILVEGYFDFAQLLQSGIGAVVASCGTALTSQQAQLLRRFTGKVILSFDPDAAGQSAAVRSCEMLVAESFSVNVALLPPREDPDTFVRQHGRDAYHERLRTSQPYLEFLLDRASRQHELGTDDGRRAFLQAMLGVAARIPDAAARDQFADRLSHKARITEEVVRSEIRKAAVARRTSLTDREVPATFHVKPAERGLIWALVHEPDVALQAMEALESEDFEALAARTVFEAARSLHHGTADPVTTRLLERLNDREARLVTSIGADPTRPAPADECVRALRLLRYDRERAALQREIDRLQQETAPDATARIEQLGLRKIDLKRRIEALGADSPTTQVG